MALKAAETDATKPTLVTSGKAFGLRSMLAVLERRQELRAPRWHRQTELRKPMSGRRPSSAPRTPLSCPTQPTPLIRRRCAQQKAAASTRASSRWPHLCESATKTTFYVASQPCMVCNRILAEGHQVRFAQPKAFGAKVGDEFTVPLCRDHHRELHSRRNERAWWHDMGLVPLQVAKRRWDETQQCRRATAPGLGRYGSAGRRIAEAGRILPHDTPLSQLISDCNETIVRHTDRMIALKEYARTGKRLLDPLKRTLVATLVRPTYSWRCLP